MKKYIILLSFFLNLLCAEAQFVWEPSNNGLPETSYIAGMAKSINGDIYTVLIHDSKGKLYKSTNEGEDWWIVSTNGLPNPWFANCLFISDNKMFTSTGGEGEDVYVSTDNGANWEPSNNGLPTTSHVIGITKVTNGDFFMIINHDSHGKLYKSSNAGNTWSIVNTNGLPSIWYANCVFVKGERMFISTGAQGQDLYVSTDNGLNWVPSNTGFPNESHIIDMAESAFGNIYTVINHDTKGKLYKSTNDGSSWSNVNISGLPSPWFANCLFISGNKMLTATGGQGEDLYKSDIITNILLHSGKNPLTIYPNPINSSFTIEVEKELIGKKFTLSDHTGRNVVVGSIIGKKTKVSTDNLKPGVYFLMVEGLPSSSKKIVKH